MHTLQQAVIWTDMKFKDCIEKAMETRRVEYTAKREKRVS